MRRALLVLLPLLAVASAQGCTSCGDEPMCFGQGEGLCTPLADGVRSSIDFVAGQPRLAHFKLTDYTAIHNEPNAEITFSFDSCKGTFDTYINTNQFLMSDGGHYPTPEEHQFNVTRGVRELTLQLLNADYYITIQGVTDGTMNIWVVTSKTYREGGLPKPGDDGAVTAKAVSESKLGVEFVASEVEDAEYKVFYLKKDHSSAPTTVCRPPDVNTDCRAMHTVCGMEQWGKPATEDWLPAAPGEKLVQDIEVEVNVTYYFNVISRTTGSSGAKLAYRGTLASNNPERVRSAQDPGTILAISVTAGGLFVLMLVLIAFVKCRLHSTIQKKMGTKKYILFDL
eukprot:PLAT3013.1.p2 GENE.PLAT3013.1~~PLAT3013.1.p2  ORF type:complete len:354 (+),score=162.68 PLAT3013.1:43-1062(+)